MSQTKDSFLGGRINLIQPLDGYRAGIDTVFLAAAVQAKPNEKVLDVGAGVGGAAIALAARCPEVHITGVEIQSDLVQLALTNIHSNNLLSRVEMVEGNILSPPSSLALHSFDQVMTNPPYYEEDRSKSSPVPGKAQANTETTDLKLWINFCLKMLKPKGVFTMIHRAERLFEILLHLENRIGGLVVHPLWPGSGKPAGRVLVQGRKNVGGELRLLPGLTLHGGSEKYSSEAEAILRHAEALSL